ncbi:MAG: zinc-binding dehydrogenase [Armatimonadetes bacterium]|nr:zinc-binding dehydrogenase [Armatimonadota bacterium]
MKAIQVTQSGAPDVLQIIETPTPTPGAGEVLVKVAAAGINFADLMAREGKYPPAPKPPFVNGMEVAGVVESVGAGVESVKTGTRVFGMVNFGGYAEYALLAANRSVPLPDGVDFATATALLVQGLTAYFLLEEARLAPGESVLVNAAAGGVGSLAVQIAKLKGAGVVVGTASTEDKRRMVTELGADAAVDYTQSGWSKSVLDATGGKGVDVFLDATGEVAGEGFDTLANGGRWMVYGAQSGNASDLTGERIFTMLFKSQSLTGYVLYRNTANPESVAKALTEMLGWVVSGKLKVETGSRFALADAAQAHIAIADRKTTGKVVLEP